MSREAPTVVIFDFDGTLVDSDEALLVPFDLLGVDRADVVMGSAVAQECERLGVSMTEYVQAYDTDAVDPFQGVSEMLARLDRWAVLSNKHPEPAAAELARLGWEPEVVMCADAFDWEHKSLAPLMDAMGVDPAEVVMVGDSLGDVRCAEEAGARFLWAGWNPRVRMHVSRHGSPHQVAVTPLGVLALLGFC